MDSGYKNILIMKPSSLGDIVLALPAVSALRRNFPDAKISWLIRPEFAPLIENHPHIDEIIIFERRFFGKAWRNPKAFYALVQFILGLRRKNFDAVIDFHNLFRTASLGWLSGCKKRFGMAKAREFSSIFYTDTVVHNESCIHLVDFYLKIVKLIGVCDSEVRFVFPEDPAAISYIHNLLKKRGIEKGNYAVFVAGSAHKNKCWPVEKFAELADKISQSYKLPIVIIGTESDKYIADKLKSLSSANVFDFSGLTNLPQLTVLLESAKLVVSNDTGPGHIAAALGKPLIMIFGWSNPSRIAPYKKMECVVGVEIDKRGMKLDGDPIRYSVDRIPVKQVFEKVCEQIERKTSNN